MRDRIKDMIISGGENIYPAEVETALASHPAVLEVGVIGVPSAKWGEDVKAFVVLRKGHQASAEELIAHTKTRIASFKAPKSVEFIDALPATPRAKFSSARCGHPTGRRRQPDGGRRSWISSFHPSRSCSLKRWARSWRETGTLPQIHPARRSMPRAISASGEGSAPSSAVDPDASPSTGGLGGGRVETWLSWKPSGRRWRMDRSFRRSCSPATFSPPRPTQPPPRSSTDRGRRRHGRPRAHGGLDTVRSRLRPNGGEACRKFLPSHGHQVVVLQGSVATHLLVTARTDDGDPSLFLVASDAPGVEIEGWQGIDGQPGATLRMEGVEALCQIGDAGQAAAVLSPGSTKRSSPIARKRSASSRP